MCNQKALTDCSSLKQVIIKSTNAQIKEYAFNFECLRVLGLIYEQSFVVNPNPKRKL